MLNSFALACKNVLFVAFLLLTAAAGFAQDISGVWEGNYGKNLLTTLPKKLVIEINISHDSVISGLSHLYYNNGKYEHYLIRGLYHRHDSTIVFSEDSTIAVNLGLFESSCLGKYTTRLKITDTRMRLEGRWKDKQIFGCPSTTVWLEKKLPRLLKNTSQADSLQTNRPTLMLPAKTLTRETDIQQLLEIPLADKDSIKIELYDNGEVDGDSVSLYLDDKEIISRQQISEKAVSFYISLEKYNPLTKLRLVAESLGSIPPCTAVMIISTKHKRQQVNLSSNFNKNATVEFFLKE